MIYPTANLLSIISKNSFIIGISYPYSSIRAQSWNVIILLFMACKKQKPPRQMGHIYVRKYQSIIDLMFIIPSYLQEHKYKLQFTNIHCSENQITVYLKLDLSPISSQFISCTNKSVACGSCVRHPTSHWNTFMEIKQKEATFTKSCSPNPNNFMNN